ncbi:hypothetical protein FRC09_015882 [Ceratobasidium sp. 395]|nr:hypothetical protein FRC09_015882 [Ceratobasidium sp. 395]
MFSTIDLRSALPPPPPKEKPHAIFIDHFRKVSRSKLAARAKSNGRSHTKKQAGPKKHATRSPSRLPELLHDSTVSEESTPISTPTHPEFDLRIAQGQINDKSGKASATLYEGVPPPTSPLANKSKGQMYANSKVWRGPCPPPAPRIDTGSFDTSFQDSNPEASFNSSASVSFSVASSVDISFPLPSMDRQILPNGIQSLEAMFPREQLDELRATLGIETEVDGSVVGTTGPRFGCVPPPAPRPDTGTWSYMDPSTPNFLFPSVPVWMSAPGTYRLPTWAYIPPAGTANWPQPQPQPPRLHRGELNSYLNPSASLGWNMGLGLDLHAVADIPGPELGENSFVRPDLECEQCLMELFPSRAPRGSMVIPPAVWTTTNSSGRRFGASHEYASGRTVAQGGYLSASGAQALGYRVPERAMRGRDSVRADHQTGAQSVWTRPIDPIPVVLAEVDGSGGLLPPIELARRRVGV